jgi:D-tyrosyl-tRNA(Tyr) deacylase
MRAIIQRVSEASVDTAQIQKGLLVLLGITPLDSQVDIDWLAHKLLNLRIFDDANSQMNHSLLSLQLDLIVVSQFTLFASTKKGNRPSYSKAAKAEIAIPLYENFIKTLEQLLGKKVGTGIFGTDMKVSLINDGPVTIAIDSYQKE